MQNKWKSFLLLFSLMVSGTALADSTADSLSRIEAETLVLKAREKQLEVQSLILSKQGEITSKRIETDRLTRAASAGDPIIRSIEGIGKTLYATLGLDNGNTIDVKVGDVLPNGMKVVSIRPNEVIVETQKSRRIRLATGAPILTPNNPAYPNAAVGLPPLAPMSPARGLSR